MKRKITLAILAMIVAVSLASEPPEESVNLVIKIDREIRSKGLVSINIEMLDDKANAYVASREQLSDSPEWSGKGKPPLGLEQTLKKAWDEVFKTEINKETLQLSDIGLFRITGEEFQNRWFYVVTFKESLPYENGCKYEYPKIYVLMSGAIIAPMVYPKK